MLDAPEYPDFHKRSCLRRAKEQLELGTESSLRYACLELRLCMESIIYEKVAHYDRFLPPRVLDTWQPRALVEALLRVEPAADQGFTLRLVPEGPDGQPVGSGTVMRHQTSPPGISSGTTTAWGPTSTLRQ